MGIFTWIAATAEYARSLASSGWEGARSSRQAAQDGSPVATVLTRSVRDSVLPAAVGAYIGALGASLGTRRKRAYGIVAISGVLGGVIGFASGMAWGTRHLTGNMARGARQGIGARRDEHWLERHPIDYA